MEVMIGHQRVRLSDRNLLGVGGEARVYGWQGQAVKVYHTGASSPSGSQALAPALLGERMTKVQAFPGGLPGEVVGPLELVSDASSSALLGFTMKAVRGGEDVRRLSVRSWREGVVSNETVTSLFQRIHALLEGLHARGVVVGDFNDSNVLFVGEHPWLIDADSMQFGGFPCIVAHEKFLDPRLFGIDLTKGPRFSPGSDWYAFAVMLFSSLLYVHPYGGVCGRHPTLLRRAEARHSILRDDVKFPRSAVHFRVLPDELLDWFERVFDHDQRDRFPERLLRLTWLKCACGLTHARPTCPQCAPNTPKVIKQVAEFHGRCQAARIFSTPGRILCATVQGGLKYVYEQEGLVFREDGSLVMPRPPVTGMRFAICGRATWVGHQGRLVRIEKGQTSAAAATASFANEPSFDACATGAFRLDREWLIEADSGRRIGQVLEDQTWFRTGDQLGFGFYRAGLLTVYFVFETRRPGLRTVSLPPIHGRLVEAFASFDAGQVLFQMVTERDGRTTHHIHVIGADGKVRASLEGPADSSRSLSNLEGRVILGDRVLCATDQGLLSLEVDSRAGTLTEGRLFVDSEPFVAAGATLLPGPGGSVYVVTPREIMQLTLIP